MILALMVAAGAVALGAVYVVGRVHGARAFWIRLLRDRSEGEAALERLAVAHHARVEMVDLP